jgi:hypothetical protein
MYQQTHEFLTEASNAVRISEHQMQLQDGPYATDIDQLVFIYLFIWKKAFTQLYK